MVYLNLHFVCEIFTEDDCDHPVTILCMVYDHPINFDNLLGMVFDQPGFFFSDNLLEIVCDHSGIAVVLFSTEFLS